MSKKKKALEYDPEELAVDVDFEAERAAATFNSPLKEGPCIGFIYGYVEIGKQEPSDEAKKRYNSKPGYKAKIFVRLMGKYAEENDGTGWTEILSMGVTYSEKANAYALINALGDESQVHIAELAKDRIPFKAEIAENKAGRLGIVFSTIKEPTRRVKRKIQMIDVEDPGQEAAPFHFYMWNHGTMAQMRSVPEWCVDAMQEASDYEKSPAAKWIPALKATDGLDDDKDDKKDDDDYDDSDLDEDDDEEPPKPKRRKPKKKKPVKKKKEAREFDDDDF